MPVGAGRDRCSSGVGSRWSTRSWCGSVRSVTASVRGRSVAVGRAPASPTPSVRSGAPISSSNQTSLPSPLRRLPHRWDSASTRRRPRPLSLSASWSSACGFDGRGSCRRSSATSQRSVPMPTDRVSRYRPPACTTALVASSLTSSSATSTRSWRPYSASHLRTTSLAWRTEDFPGPRNVVQPSPTVGRPRGRAFGMVVSLRPSGRSARVVRGRSATGPASYPPCVGRAVGVAGGTTRIRAPVRQPAGTRAVSIRMVHPSFASSPDLMSTNSQT